MLPFKHQFTLIVSRLTVTVNQILSFVSLTVSTGWLSQHQTRSATYFAKYQVLLIIVPMSISVTACRKSTKLKNSPMHASCSMTWWTRSTMKQQTCLHVDCTTEMFPSCSWCKTLSTRTNTWGWSMYSISCCFKIRAAIVSLHTWQNSCTRRTVAMCRMRIQQENLMAICCSTSKANRTKIWDWECKFSPANDRSCTCWKDDIQISLSHVSLKNLSFLRTCRKWIDGRYANFCRYWGRSCTWKKREMCIPKRLRPTYQVFQRVCVTSLQTTFRRIEVSLIKESDITMYAIILANLCTSLKIQHHIVQHRGKMFKNNISPKTHQFKQQKS